MYKCDGLIWHKCEVPHGRDALTVIDLKSEMVDQRSYSRGDLHALWENAFQGDEGDFESPRAAGVRIFTRVSVVLKGATYHPCKLM